MGSLQRLGRASGVIAVLTGTYGFLSLMGAFGPVSCWRGYTVTGSAASNGTETVSEPTVTSGCTSGVDFLLGAAGPPGGGNAQVLFSWAFVLLLLVALVGFAVWTDRRRVVWGMGAIGAVISIVGLWSIGWYFVLPTLFTLVAAGLLELDARRQGSTDASA